MNKREIYEALAKGEKLRYNIWRLGRFIHLTDERIVEDDGGYFNGNFTAP